jgi:carboxymethylenebutenolidase
VVWAAQQGAAADRLGITGFCWGGRITWLYAAHNPALKAGVAWYGRLLGDISPMNPKRAIDLAGSLKAPVLGLYGGADTGIPMNSVAAMQEALANGSPAARRSRFVVFPDAPHAFHADYRPTYRKAAAEEGWALALDWFKKHGVA